MKLKPIKIIKIKKDFVTNKPSKAFIYKMGNDYFIMAGTNEVTADYLSFAKSIKHAIKIIKDNYK